ncbi:MAG: AraC family ligand binding domain-containing protein [Rhizobiales bacterium]|jgi:glyoxylate utilization-related uncharacterized protein|nr:AraC family ligand binding domain-containing protein [Hyphomicrobiales bacterium]
MTTTFIDTNAIKPARLQGMPGSHAQIINQALCGAEKALATLRWLERGEHFKTPSDPNVHQLVYLMDGEAVITLDDSRYPVTKGGGVYLEPSEKATITQAGTAPLKLFHLTVKRDHA